MATDQGNLSSKLTVSAAILICCVAAFAVLYGPRLIAYHYLRQMYRDEPTLALTPQPLKDYGANPQEGMSFSQFGYAFDAPWKDVDTVRNFKSLTLISFKSGQTVVFYDPKQTIDPLKVIRETTAQNGKDLGVLFGRDVPTSNYQVLNTVLSTTPDDYSLLWLSNDLVRHSILLTIKHGELVNGVSRVYSIETEGLRGFQKGDPLHDEKATIVDLFDKQDHHFELWFVTQKGASARITQADINRVIETIRPAPVTN